MKQRRRAVDAILGHIIGLFILLNVLTYCVYQATHPAIN